MPIVLPNDVLALQLPQPRIVVAASRYQVRRVGRESAVPHPALMAVQLLLEFEADFFGVHLVLFVLLARGRSGVFQIYSPDPRRVIRGAGCEMADVRGQQDAGNVRAVRLEARHGDEGRHVPNGDQAPHVHRAVHVIADGCAEERAIGGDRDGRHALVLLGHELVRALVLREVPDADIASAITRDEFALVGVDHHVIYGHTVGVVALNMAGPRVPYLDSSWTTQSVAIENSR